jgi:phage tail tape-measure protein
MSGKMGMAVARVLRDPGLCQGDESARTIGAVFYKDRKPGGWVPKENPDTMAGVKNYKGLLGFIMMTQGA